MNCPLIDIGVHGILAGNDKDVIYLNPKDCCKYYQVVDRRHAEPTLPLRDRLDRNAQLFAELIQRKPALLPELSDPLSGSFHIDIRNVFHHPCTPPFHMI